MGVHREHNKLRSTNHEVQVDRHKNRGQRTVKCILLTAELCTEVYTVLKMYMLDKEHNVHKAKLKSSDAVQTGVHMNMFRTQYSADTHSL